MAERPWRERLKQALDRQALPTDYVDRLVEELSDHAADFSLEESSMEAHTEIEKRLGSPQQLALAAKREFQQRTFAGRHPALVFLGGPVVAVVMTLVISLLVFAGGCWLLDIALGCVLGPNDAAADSPPTSFELMLIHGGSWIVRFLPFAVTACFYARLGRRCARPVWGGVACSIVAVSAICFCSTITAPSPDGHLGSWMMGFGWRGFGNAQVLQAGVPVALAVWVFASQASRRSLVLQ